MILLNSYHILNMNSSIHTHISKCLKNLKNLPSCSISYKVLWVNILLRSQLLTSATLKNNVLTKKNCWNNFTSSVRSSHLFIFDLYFGWRFRSQTLFFVTSWRKEKNRKYWLSFLFFHGTMTTINIFNTKFS